MCFVTFSFAQDSEQLKNILEEKLKNELPEQQLSTKEACVSFNYKDKPLWQIIQDIANYKGINVLLPQGSQEITATITYAAQEKLTVDQAWNELNRILNLAGYTWLEEQNKQLQLVKIDKDATKREIIPLYVNPSPNELPDTANIIQTIFYLANLKLGDNDQLVSKILKGSDAAGQEGMLSVNADVKVIKDQNALIITDKSENIKAAMKIVMTLDMAGIPDAIEVVPLYYIQASYVENVFKELIRPVTGSNPVLGPPKEERSQASYFSEGTKVLALNRTNSIVIMGTVRDIKTVKDFIIKYMDHLLESGKSILHIYDLQYLDAETFAPQLQNLVSSGSVTGQAQVQGAVGPRQDFKNVIIIPEPTKQSTNTINPQGTSSATNVAPISEGVSQGGNRLIIAAQRKDWLRIKDFIKKVDKPQLQVAIEVLVVDLVLANEQDLGSQMRTPDGFSDIFNNNLNFQTANLNSPILKDANNNNLPADALAANLLKFNESNSNIANQSTPGTTVITLSDPNGSVWNIWKILSQFTNSILLAQPFVTTQDNQQAVITSSTQRFLTGGAAAESGAVDVKNEYVNADIAINILPHISDATGNVNLNITINVNQFTNPSGSGINTRTTRLVQTCANLGNGEILAIGGLIQEQQATASQETPLLSKVPILGWFFKNRNQNRRKTNLLVFISPTIINPRKKGGIGKYSESKMCFAEGEIAESINFQGLRDPITRWFFKPDLTYAKRVTDDFVGKQAMYFQEDITGENIQQTAPITMAKAQETPVKSPMTLAQNIVQPEVNSINQLKQLLNDTENPLIR